MRNRGDPFCFAQFLRALAIELTTLHGLLFVVRPQAEHFDDALSIQNLIDDTVLDIDAPRICTRKITDKFFVRRGILVRVCFEHL